MEESSATLYFIISCQEFISLNENSVKITLNSKEVKLLEKEVISVKRNNYCFMPVKELNNCLNGKNVFLYKIKINSSGIDKYIYVNLEFRGDKLISKYPIIINNNTSYTFIYNIQFTGQNFINYKLFRSNDSNEFVSDKFRINKAQQFLIFKEYINVHENQNGFEYLLERTADEIINAKDIIDIEFILLFSLNLFNIKNDFSEVNLEKQSFLESIICNFINIEKTIIKNYNNEEYNQIIDKIEKYRDEVKDKNLILNLDSFILLFYQMNSREKFKIFFKKLAFKNEVINYMLKHQKYFTKYDFSELEMIYETKYVNISYLLELSLNSNEYIKFFCSHIKDIENEGFIELKNCPVLEENFDYKYLERFIDFIINNSKLFFPSNQFEQLIERLKLKNFEKLEELKSIFQKYGSNWKANKINEKINKAFHETGKQYIQNYKFTNEQIIDFIHEDAKVFYEDYEKNREFVYLIDYIDMNKIDNNFYKKFDCQNYNYKNLFKENYKTFINCIISKAESFKHIKILFELFNVYNSTNVNKEIIWELTNIFQNKALKMDLQIEEISRIVGTLFKFFNNDIDFHSNLLINGIKRYFSEEQLNNIFINILNDRNIKLASEVIDKLINLISKNIDNLAYQSIILILNKFTNNIEAQKSFLEKQKKKIISEDEIYNIKISDNLQFVKYLINNGFFEENYKNVNYIKKTKEFMIMQSEKLKNLIFSMEQLKKLYTLKNSKDKNNNLKTRLFIISLGDNSISTTLYRKLNSIINSCYKTYEMLQKVINIFSIYYPNEKNNVIEEYRKIIEFINENPISNFPNNIKNLEKNYNIADELFKLKDSKIFIIIFDIFKNEILFYLSNYYPLKI